MYQLGESTRATIHTAGTKLLRINVPRVHIIGDRTSITGY